MIAKVDEEEARVEELRARSRAGKERQVRISEGALQEWQETMDGGRILISQPKQRRRRKRLRKHNGLASGGGSVASFFFSVVPPSSPAMVPPPISPAQVLRWVLVQLHWRPW
jgi:hypothetical protein